MGIAVTDAGPVQQHRVDQHCAVALPLRRGGEFRHKVRELLEVELVEFVQALQFGRIPLCQ